MYSRHLFKFLLRFSDVIALVFACPCFLVRHSRLRLNPAISLTGGRQTRTARLTGNTRGSVGIGWPKYVRCYLLESSLQVLNEGNLQSLMKAPMTQAASNHLDPVRWGLSNTFMSPPPSPLVSKQQRNEGPLPPVPVCPDFRGGTMQLIMEIQYFSEWKWELTIHKMIFKKCLLHSDLLYYIAK